MTRGPKPRPAAEKKKRGTYQPYRDKDEVALSVQDEQIDIEAIQSDSRFLQTIPDPPELLKGNGIKEWNRVLRLALDVQGWILVSDLSALENHCFIYQMLFETKQALKNEGYLNKKGRINAHFMAYRDLQNQYYRTCAQFGLTPSDRVKVKLERPEKAQRKETFKL